MGQWQHESQGQEGWLPCFRVSFSNLRDWSITEIALLAGSVSISKKPALWWCTSINHHSKFHFQPPPQQQPRCIEFHFRHAPGALPTPFLQTSAHDLWPFAIGNAPHGVWWHRPSIPGITTCRWRGWKDRKCDALRLNQTRPTGWFGKIFSLGVPKSPKQHPCSDDQMWRQDLSPDRPPTRLCIFSTHNGR